MCWRDTECPVGSQRRPISLSTATDAILNFVIVAVGIITIVDSISSYLESYMMTSVGQWVAYDIRRTVYHDVERCRSIITIRNKRVLDHPNDKRY
jgi:hypothetical protein